MEEYHRRRTADWAANAAGRMAEGGGAVGGEETTSTRYFLARKVYGDRVISLEGGHRINYADLVERKFYGEEE